MSQDNVETLYRLYEAFNRRDFDAAVQYLHPDGEVYPALEPVERVGDTRGHFRGREGLREFFGTLDDAWEAVTIEVHEMSEGADGRILAVENWRVRGPQGIEIDTKMTDVYAFKDGLIIRCDGFRQHEKALEAAGLSE